MNQSSSAYPSYITGLLDEAMQEALRRRAVNSEKPPYEKYQRNPAKFGHDFFGHNYTDDVKRLMHSVVKNTITVARSSMGTGKTFSASAMALWFYKTFPNAQVYVTAAPPLDNLKNILWGEILDVVKKRPEHFEKDRITELRIAESSRHFITGVTIPMTGTSAERKSKFSGKHSSHIFFIVDEGDAVPHEVYEGIEGCMSGGMARLLIMFNPRDQSGPIFEMENKQRASIVHLSAFRHPNVITGKDIIPGAVSRETVVRRINEWTRPLIEGEAEEETTSFSIPDFLVGTTAKSLSGEIAYPPLPSSYRAIVEPAFSYMVLGEYPAQGENQLISREWIDAARKRWDDWVAVHGETPPVDTPPRLGLDVGEYGTDFNVPMLRYRNYVSRVRRIWQGVDTTITASIAGDICRHFGVDIVLVDGTGPGSGVAPMMARAQRGLRAISVKVSNSPGNFLRTELGEFNILRDQLWWALREWLRTPEDQAMLPPEPMLIEELLCPTYKVENGKIYVMKKEDMRNRLRRSPNYADALALTFLPADRARILRLTE